MSRIHAPRPVPTTRATWHRLRGFDIRLPALLHWVTVTSGQLEGRPQAPYSDASFRFFDGLQVVGTIYDVTFANDLYDELDIGENFPFESEAVGSQERTDHHALQRRRDRKFDRSCESCGEVP